MICQNIVRVKPYNVYGKALSRNGKGIMNWSAGAIFRVLRIPLQPREATPPACCSPYRGGTARASIPFMAPVLREVLSAEESAYARIAAAEGRAASSEPMPHADASSASSSVELGLAALRLDPVPQPLSRRHLLQRGLNVAYVGVACLGSVILLGVALIKMCTSCARDRGGKTAPADHGAARSRTRGDRERRGRLSTIRERKSRESRWSRFSSEEQDEGDGEREREGEPAVCVAVGGGDGRVEHVE